MLDLSQYKDIVQKAGTFRKVGQVTQIIGLVIESDGPSSSIGDLCHIYTRMDKEPIWAEVVGFKADKVLLMPLGDMEGLRPGANVINTGGDMEIKVGPELLGRVLDGIGRPIDEAGPIRSHKYYSTKADKINPLTRKRINQTLIMGIKSIDGFMTIGKGQRMGIFRWKRCWKEYYFRHDCTKCQL